VSTPITTRSPTSRLPGSTGKPLPYLMYPQAEVAGTRRDSLDPDRFKYTITAREE